MKQGRGWALCALLAVVAPVLASPPLEPAWERGFDGRVLAHARDLARQGGAENLYLAWRLTTTTDLDANGIQAPELENVRGQWLQQALAAPGDSLLVARAALLHCSTDSDCRQASANYQRLGGDDAGAWLRGDAAGHIDEASWAVAAASGRYLSSVEVELPAVLQASAGWDLLPPPPGTALDGLAYSGQDVLAATAFAALTIDTLHDPSMAVVRQCQAAEPGSLRDQQCRAIFEALAASPTLAQANLGAALRASLATNADDHAQWQQRHRALEWLFQHGVPLVGKQPVHAFLQQVAARGERAAWEEQLLQAGIPLQPPAGWEPELPPTAGP